MRSENIALYVNYNMGAFNFIVTPAPCSRYLALTKILSSSELKQMVFVTNEHILAKFKGKNYKKGDETVTLWRIFNVKDGTLTLQNS